MAEGYHGVHEKLVDRFGTKGDALYTFVACGLALAVSGLAAWLFKQPALSEPRADGATVLRAAFGRAFEPAQHPDRSPRGHPGWGPSL
jgi:hypothetical protein